jgi:parallel beta-helix repeat protein
VVLKNCSGITVQKLNLANNGNGVLLYYTNGSTVSGNVVTNNLEGITLKWSSGNVISGNRVTNSKGYGVYLYLSDNNVIPKNEIVFNGADGVNFEYSISNTATENHVTENSGNGIFFRSIQNSNVIGNNVTLNKGCGIGFGYGPNGTINGNFISRNGLGIWISNAAENTITWNTIAENEGWGIRLEGAQKNNIINHNNFINNSVTEGLQASILGIWTYPGLEKPRSGPLTQEEMPKFVAGATNAWDDGKEGNYWSDYTTRYPNASAVGTSTVGDTPYFINENNMDRNPLMNPVTDNSTSPEQQQEEEDFAGAKLPVEYAVAVTAVIGAVGILAASAYLVLKRKKATAKTTSVT